MIKFENIAVYGWEEAIRGMRNPMNSWEKSDSIVGREVYIPYYQNNPYIIYDRYGKEVYIGDADLDLMKRLRNAGTDHRKFMRMIVVYTDITAPLYWWKEFDTYKVGTVANSCSTMHKIAAKEFTLDDFSHEHLAHQTKEVLRIVIDDLNDNRSLYLKTKNKGDWWQMIQMLPSSYNQKRTVMMNYEVLANVYKSRKAHKLDEWKEHNEQLYKTSISDDSKRESIKGYFGFCDWIKTLPYSELITGGK